MKVVLSSQKVTRRLHPFNFKEDMWPDDKIIQDFDLGKKDSKDQQNQ